MRAAQFVGAKRDAMVKVAVLSGAGMLALALATPARADDQTAPPPLMLSKTAVIAPDEPDATVPVDAAAAQTESTAPAPAPDPTPVRVVAPSGWELAGKAPVVHHPAPVRVHTRAAYVAPSPVISAPLRPVHMVRAHHASKRARAATAKAPPRWYQVTPAQYRHARADSRSGHPQPAAAAALAPAAGIAAAPLPQPRGTRTSCQLRLRKCLQICSWNAANNGAQNERWIGACISSYEPVPRLDKLHELLLQRLWSIALDARRTASGRQYQCYGAQYQSGTCAAARSPHVTSTFGWEAVAPQTVAAQTDRRMPAAPVHTVARSLAQVTSRRPEQAVAPVVPHGTRSATKTVVRQRPDRTREVAPAAKSDASTDWLLRSLVALIAVAMLALLLAAFSELPAAGSAVTGMRTRLASKGLSSGRIDLGRGGPGAPPRGKGISYRD